jgi:hypothetical protein
MIDVVKTVHMSTSRNKNAMPIMPVKRRPSIKGRSVKSIRVWVCIRIWVCVGIWVCQREAESNSDRYACIRTRRSPEHYAPGHECN